MSPLWGLRSLRAIEGDSSAVPSTASLAGRLQPLQQQQPHSQAHVQGISAQLKQGER